MIAVNGKDKTGNGDAPAEVRSLVVGPLATNCHVLLCPRTRRAAVVDPGFEAERILHVVDELAARVEFILLTHGHVDHVGGAAQVAGATGAKVAIHDADRSLLETAPQMASMFGMRIDSVPEPDISLREGQSISVGDLLVDVVHTPGHTEGSVCFHLPGNRLLLAGDTLFYRGVGRTDLPGGSWPKLLQSIRQKLYRLDGDTQVLTGHGPATILREEMQSNPFVRSL